MEILNGVQQTDQNKAWLNGARDMSGTAFGLNEYLNGVQQTVSPSDAAESTPYSDAWAGWTLYDLGEGYGGNLVRVRRDNDEDEQDFGLVGGSLDTAGILSHCGVNSGYIVKVYDAIGARDMVQSTASDQPRIVDSGTLDTDSAGDPVSRHLGGGSSKYLEYAAPESFTSFSVLIKTEWIQTVFDKRCFHFKDSTGSTNVKIFAQGSGGALSAEIKSDNANQVVLTGSTDLEDSTIRKVCLVVDKGADLAKIYVSGTEEDSASIVPLDTFEPDLFFWTTDYAPRLMTGKLNALVLWDRALTADEVASL